MPKHFKILNHGDPDCIHTIKIDFNNIGRCSCGREIDYGIPAAADGIRNPESSRRGGHVTAYRKLQAKAGTV